MTVQMWHGFACIRSIIKDQSKTGLIQSQFFGDLRSFEQEVTQNLVVFRLSFSDSRDRLLGNDQHMDRRLRLNILEGEYQLVFVNDAGRHLASDNFLEQGLAHAQFTPPP